MGLLVAHNFSHDVLQTFVINDRSKKHSGKGDKPQRVFLPCPAPRHEGKKGEINEISIKASSID